MVVRAPRRADGELGKGPTSRDSSEYRTTEVIEMNTVTRIQVKNDYRLEVEFSDGVQGEVDLSDRLLGSVFEPLRDLELFRKASVDDFGAICWPNGADLAPDALYARLQSQPRVTSGN